MSIGEYFRVIATVILIGSAVHICTSLIANCLNKAAGLAPEIKKRKMLKKMSNISDELSKDLLSVHCIGTTCSKCPYYRHVITPDDYEKFIKSFTDNKNEADNPSYPNPLKTYLYNSFINAHYKPGNCIFKEIQTIIDSSLK